MINSTIYKTSIKLRDLVRRAQYFATNVDRVSYFPHLFESTGSMISGFALSYRLSNPQDKKKYSEVLMAAFEITVVDIRMILDNNLLHANSKHADKDVKALKYQMAECLSKLEFEIPKWCNSCSNKVSTNSQQN